MKIYIRIIKDDNFQNYENDIMIIKSNKISVNSLKNRIKEKYGFDPSSQRLFIKIFNKQLVLMTNEFPLQFYYIKEKSIIYIEHFESKKKLKRIPSSKNVKSFSDLHKPSVSIADTDTKSSSFSEISHSNKLILSEEKLDIIKNFNKAILTNDLKKFRDILNNYKFIDINSPIDELKKYAPIHYAVINGYKDMVQELIGKYNADVNLISADNWTPLHLSVYKGHYDIVNMLLKHKNINCDISLPNIGTPLHCACKKNNSKIITLLLNKCDPNIKNQDGKLPIDITNDINIKKLKLVT